MQEGSSDLTFQSDFRPREDDNCKTKLLFYFEKTEV
jgi:hypothetical protein